MTDAIIEVKQLSKSFLVPVRQEGLAAAVKSLVNREYRRVEAVKDINFSIARGEVVGFLGPNGAGKTTTLKMLSGLIFPTSGEARVAGFVPWKRQAPFLQSISMVLGNKSQMIWDIPALDTLQVLGEIYHLSPEKYRTSCDELIAMLEMEDLLTKPVRNLSLGERMKCELAAGLLHRPQVLFLDEPTLGLDVSMQKRLRSFLAEYARRQEATVLLTSHYMADVVALCRRIILIHRGGILYDGELDQLAEKLNPFQVVRIGFENGTGETVDAAALVAGISSKAQILQKEAGSLSLRLHRTDVPGFVGSLLQKIPVTEIAVEDAPIEAVLDQIYREGDL